MLGTKYELLPKEFSVLAEFNYRTLKAANSDLTNYSVSKTTKSGSSKETAFTLAGQYMLDDKLSFIPSYSYYRSDLSLLWADNATGGAFDSGRKELKGSNGKSAQFQQALGLFAEGALVATPNYCFHIFPFINLVIRRSQVDHSSRR